MDCGACGTSIPEGSAFCAACGARQAEAPPPPTTSGGGWEAAIQQGRRAPRPPSSSSRVVWIVAGLSALGLAALVGIGLLLLAFGMRVLNEQVRVELRDNPVIRQHIGEPEPLELDFMGTAADPDDDVFVFRVKGPLGSGRVSASLVTRDDGSEEVTGGTLRLDSGDQFDLFPEAEAEEDAAAP